MPDGLWSSMKWVSQSNLVLNNGIYQIPAQGGKFTFTCTNYKAPWMGSLPYADSVWLPRGISEGEDEWHKLSCSWFAAEFNQADLTITVAALPDTVDSRLAELEVTAGDIFYHFKFNQSRPQK